jgi:hypothetical protein
VLLLSVLVRAAFAIARYNNAINVTSFILKVLTANEESPLRNYHHIRTRRDVSCILNLPTSPLSQALPALVKSYTLDKQS